MGVVGVVGVDDMRPALFTETDTAEKINVNLRQVQGQ